jgi:uncharacterized protein DUF4124
MKKLFLLLLLFAPAAGAAYKCVDERGVTHIGDTPPEACATVMMQEVSRSGAILRNIEPTPTGEQIKAKRDEQERRKEAEKAALEQKRKDMALLNSFSNEREFDVTRDRNIEPLKLRIKNAHERMQAVDKRTQEIEEEMEFYKAGKSKTVTTKSGTKQREAPVAPVVLVHELDRLKKEKASLEKSIVTSEQEIEQLKAKFDTDKKRWVGLKASGGVSKPPDPAPPAEPKKAPPADTKPAATKK